MDFMKYFETGEETPDKSVEEKERVIKIPLEESSGQSESPQEISEGLVDVIFQNLKTNTKVSVSGPIILFRWEWVLTKTYISIRVRKKIFKDFVDWLNKILEYSEDTSK